MGCLVSFGHPEPPTHFTPSLLPTCQGYIDYQVFVQYLYCTNTCTVRLPNRLRQEMTLSKGREWECCMLVCFQWMWCAKQKMVQVQYMQYSKLRVPLCSSATTRGARADKIQLLWGRGVRHVLLASKWYR
jgi:hypothetical protein